jgi:FlaA1/EpsC-like NDP-sugar epimerase
VLIVGAGRSGRALARELGETPDQHVVGFVDDNPAVRNRRILGVKVLGSLDEISQHLSAARPEVVFVTIPDSTATRLQLVVSACDDEGVTCSFVRRTTEPSTQPLARVRAE